MKIQIFIGAILLSLGSIVCAEDPVASFLEVKNCTSEEMIKEIQSDFKFSLEDSDREIQINNCDLTSIPNKFIRALAYLKKAQYNRSYKSKDEFFLNTLNSTQTPYAFLRQRVQNIRFTYLGNCQSLTTAAYVNRTIQKTFFVCLAPKLSLTAYFYAVSALHEAKHLDPDDLDHVTCTQGSGRGKPASCDEFKEKEAAYFYNAEYPALLARFGKNIHPSMKAYVRAAAMYSILNNFNEVPKISNSSMVILKDVDGNLSTFNSSKQFKTIFNIQNQKIFSQTNGTFNLYSENHRVFTGWNPYDGLTAPNGAIANDYNNNAFQNRPLIQDIYYGDYSFGMIQPEILSLSLRFNYQTKQFDKEVQIKTPFKKAQGFLNPSLCDGEKNNLYIQTEDQKVFEASLNDQKEIQFKELKNCKLVFLNIVHLNQLEVGLSANGKILEQLKGQWQVVPDLINKKFDYMSRPLSIYDFFL